MKVRLSDFVADLHRRGVVGREYTEYTPLSGGTTSVVAKLAAAGAGNEDKSVYVIKANVPALNREEARFLTVYQGIELLPTLHDLAPDHRFLLYRFLPGEIKVESEHKVGVLLDLVEGVINRYQLVDDSSVWGWCEEPSDRWQAFLLRRVQRAAEVVGEWLSPADRELVCELALLPHRVPESTSGYLLHGDCGVHNFLICEGRLSGVIDPTPVVGTPIYDLLYAFFSSADRLSEEVLQQAVARLTNWQEPVPNALYEEVLIALYSRIGTCLRHHPVDLPRYLAAWQQWKSIYLKGKEKLVRK